MNRGVSYPTYQKIEHVLVLMLQAVETTLEARLLANCLQAIRQHLGSFALVEVCTGFE